MSENKTVKGYRYLNQIGLAGEVFSMKLGNVTKWTKDQ